MKVCVTGGGGFIGSHVVDCLLSAGYPVLIIDNFYSGCDHWKGKAARPEIEVVDILSRSSLAAAFKKHEPEAVFHMAAHHYIPFCEGNPVDAYELNVRGTLNVLYEAFGIGVKRFFFASTADVYAPSSRPHSEDDALGPFNVYGRTKLICESICRGVVEWGWRPNILIGRIFNAVGARETNPHLVPEVIQQIADGATELRLGNLFPTRDFVDVRTQAKAIVDATLAVAGTETVNIGSGVSVPVSRMIEIILSAANREIRVGTDPAKVRAAERNNLCGTTNRLRNLIGYVPDPAGEHLIREILATLKGRVPHEQPLVS